MGHGSSSDSVRRVRGLWRPPRLRVVAEPGSADGHHDLTPMMMNTGAASRYRNSPHTARGIPLSSNPTTALAQLPRRQPRAFTIQSSVRVRGVVQRDTPTSASGTRDARSDRSPSRDRKDTHLPALRSDLTSGIGGSRSSTRGRLRSRIPIAAALGFNSARLGTLCHLQPLPANHDRRLTGRPSAPCREGDGRHWERSRSRLRTSRRGPQAAARSRRGRRTRGQPVGC